MTRATGDTAGSFFVIRSYDPAVAPYTEVSAIVEYEETHDPGLLTIGDGKTPTKFHCSPLTRQQRRHVKTLEQTPYIERDWAFRYGIRSIVGDSWVWTPAREKPTDAIKDDALDDLERIHGVGDIDIQEVGEVIISRSVLGKGVPPASRRLPDSRRAWAQVRALLLHAERLRESREAEPSDGSPPDPATPD